MNIALKHFFPLGNGVITAYNYDQALKRSLDKGKEAAQACYELIKIKIASNCRVEKSRLSKQICEENNAKLIQEIGNIILIFKSSNNPNPKLSNLLRMRDRT